MITDQECQFESLLLSELTNLIGISKKELRLARLQSNGIVERWHRQLKASIKCYDTITDTPRFTWRMILF